MSASLTQLITDDHVILGARPKDWQHAIRLAATPLVASASVTGAYVDRMIDVVTTFGPYIVLTPGVALAHAQPDRSVTRNAMGTMTVSDGVPFGHDQNDPVRLVPCLAEALSQLRTGPPPSRSCPLHPRTHHQVLVLVARLTS